MDDQQPSAAQLLGSALNVVNAAMEIGVTLTRAADNVTARGEDVHPPPPDRGPIPNILHYGLATVTNLVRIVLPINASPHTGAMNSRPVSQPMNAPMTTTPRVHRGSVLRIPLAIENPGPEAMQDLRFTFLHARRSGGQDARTLERDVVRFEPSSLTVQPNDFEKLTVYVSPDTDTAQGLHVLTIGVLDSDFQVTVNVEVV